MFRLKLTIVILVFGLGAILVGELYLNSLESAGIENQNVLLQQADASVDAFMHQKKIARGLLANSIQNSNIPIYLSTLQTFYREMRQMEANEWKAFPNRDDASSEGRSKMVSDTDLPDRFLAALQEKISATFGTIRVDETAKQKFINKQRKRFVKCASIGFDQCVWDYTYNNYRIFSMKMSDWYGINTRSRVILVDANGFGVADSQDPKWSHIKGYAKQHPILKNTMKTKSSVTGLDLFRGEYYTSLSAPLTYKGKLVGAVEVSDPIDGSLLAQWKKIAGVSSVIVVKGKKVAASNLGPKLVDTIIQINKDNLISSKGDVKLYGTGSHVWVRKNYQVNKDGNGTSDKITIILVRNTEYITSGFSSAKVYFAVIILILMLIAFGFVASFYKDFVTPFETIDQGLHEIVNGNANYEFPYDFKDKLANTLSNSLNLTVMVLQGKPIPEDTEAGWGDDDISDTSKLSVELSDVEKTALLREPRDKYFERLFKEFAKAKHASGNPTEQEYNRFIQKIIRNENKFKTRLDAKEIRMVVVVKGKEVGLYPVVYTAEEIQKLSANLW